MLHVERDIQRGKAYNMNLLLSMFKGFLEERHVSATSYIKQRLKLRMNFHEQIVFHQPQDHSQPELVYSSKISLQDVINASFQRAGSSSSLDFEISSSCEENENNLILYKAAKIVKGDVSQCVGISLQPLLVDDLTLDNAKKALPDSLYWLLRWIISSDKTGSDSEFVNPRCSNPSDERHVITIGQDIIHSASHARVKTPKHASLAMAVRHLTGSKQIVTILNRLGHCSSYEDIEVIDASLARETLAKADLYGTVIPSNITPGAFVQVAGDNNDINEETLDGKKTTHVKHLLCISKDSLDPGFQRRHMQTTRKSYVH